MSMTLEYPFDAPSVTIELRNPDLGNSLQLDTQIRFAKSMDDTLYTYKYTPATRRYLWNFRGVTKSKKDALHDFVKQSAGREIKVTDFNDVIYQGRISNINPLETTSVHNISEGNESSDACVEDYSFSIEFEGEIV